MDLPEPTDVGPQLRTWAVETLQNAGAEVIDAGRAQTHLDEPGSTYLLDIRSLREYEHAHHDAAAHTPGGQLVQATDDIVAVRRSRIILVDTGDLVRAANTVQWLRFLHDGPISVLVYDGGTDLVRPHQARLMVEGRRRVTWDEVAQWRRAGAARLVDVRGSRRYAAGHVPGSVHGNREHLDRLLTGGQRLVLIGDADFVAEHLVAGRDMWVLDGGIAAAPMPLVADDPEYAGPVVDRTGAPEFGPERDAWYTAYFEWESALPAESSGDPFFDFDARVVRV